MSSVTTYAISTTDSEATRAVAAKLAPLLKGSEVIELASDLGGGKTTFVQGLAQALGYDGPVTSPTFTLGHVYELPSGLELHHYDLYRLGQSGVVGDELTEDIAQPHNITVIEWAGIMDGDLPADRLRVEFVVTGDNERQITFRSSGPISEQLVKGLSAT